jgi:hypothetical protein
MRSPFPGMDPYLEDPAIWLDFHERFVTYCSDTLNERLPDSYVTRIEERVTLVEVPEEELRMYRADVAVSATENPQLPAADSPRGVAGGLLTVEPVTIPLVIYDEVHESRIQILHRPDQRLVTVVELLSPTNKTKDGFLQYESKRNSLPRTRVHLVEIDLLIGGDRFALRKPLPAGNYFAFVSRGDRRPDCDVYAWSIRERLPGIPIPLLAPDPDIWLDLGELFATLYERGRYRRSLRYSGPPTAPLTTDDRQWAAAIVAGKPSP